ncbi:hypothetical protein [Chitinibacter sp. GC72]|uniref:hypothetical protein n=1 Tax=Chitinibacter sp. GC72 TaxID=1526917 RepID=UPI0012F73C12|nr:hypothetical protein [Chitinibacter sp. GC72]
MKLDYLAIASTLVVSSALSQAGVFDITTTMNGQISSDSYTSAEDAIHTLETSNLKSIYQNYTGTEAVNAQINFRGIPMTLAYPSANQTRLTLNIPSIGVNQTFTGVTRDQSEDMLVEYLKNNPDLLNVFIKESAKVSPVDPLAGNPNSLMSRSVANDAALMWHGAQGVGSTDDKNHFGVGISYNRFVSEQTGNAKEMKSDGFTLPLTYTRQFNEPNHELIVNIPLGYTTVEGAKAVDASVGLVYRHPIRSNWVLSAATAVRAAGSKDLAGAGWMLSGSLASSYEFGSDNWSLTLANMVGYYKVMKMKLDETEFNPGIRNIAYRNGLLFAMDSGWSIGDQPLSWEAFIIDTRYTGTKLFSNYQDEIGVTFGTKRSILAKDADLRVGFSYLFGENVNAFKANFGAWF